MNSLLLFALFFSAALAADLPTGLVLDGCPSGLDSPYPEFSIDNDIRDWYLHSVANLPLMKLQHGDCLTATYSSSDNGYRGVNNYVHEGSPVSVYADFYSNGPGKFTYSMTDMTDPVIVVDAAADSFILLYICEENLLGDNRGFGQVWLLTKDIDIDVEDVVDLAAYDVSGFSIPQLTRVNHDCD